MGKKQDDSIRHNWEALKSSIRREWAQLTEQEIDALEGRRDQVVARVQELYGTAKEEVERRLAALEEAVRSTASKVARQPDDRPSVHH